MSENDAQDRLSEEDAKLLIQSIEDVEREEAARVEVPAEETTPTESEAS